MKKILFPTDFSENAFHASQYAGMLAKRFDAEVIILNIYSTPVFTEFQPPYDIENFSTYMKEDADKSIKKFVEKFIKETNLPPENVSQIVEYGFTPDNIVSVANAKKVDMIVMGTKGASNILDRWLGTTAQKVMETAECPVWIIPANATISYPENILYAADFKEDEILATHKILEIAKPLDATCKVVHIHDYVELNVGHVVEETVNDLSSEFQNDDVTFKNLNRGDIVTGLETYIKTHKPDVLALAVHDKSFLSKIFDTSITQHFVQEGKLPMLTFRK
ncbi:MAG: universal stress protein [Bacteroidota bacterium]|jgi:nucleotide-binding universal stress UspA family protein